LGFLTPFQKDEMVEAVRLALGLVQSEADTGATDFFTGIDVFPPNMPTYPYEPLPRTLQSQDKKIPRFAFGLGGRICLSIRMRLECRVLNREGTVRARYNVLNEVVIDRGSSPYLAALECFCDDVHLTTVQADGVIFATPTGSTAYSMAAGGSVVHPAVPCILVTPICPHVLSFRSMVFPDHVVLDVYVPDDARSEASVSFDGKFRQDLHRGDCVEISMSPYAVSTRVTDTVWTLFFGVVCVVVFESNNGHGLTQVVLLISITVFFLYFTGPNGESIRSQHGLAGKPET
jgi:hypothetical protein